MGRDEHIYFDSTTSRLKDASEKSSYDKRAKLGQAVKYTTRMSHGNSECIKNTAMSIMASRRLSTEDSVNQINEDKE